MRATQRPPHIIDMVYYSVHIEVWESTYRPVCTATVSVEFPVDMHIRLQIHAPIVTHIREYLDAE